MLKVLPKSLEEALLEIIREEGVEDRVHGGVGVAQAVRQQDHLVYFLYYIQIQGSVLAIVIPPSTSSEIDIFP